MANSIPRNQVRIIEADARETLRAEARDVRRVEWLCPVTGEPLRLHADWKRVSAHGLGKLMEKGVATFEEATGHSLPHNLIYSQMSGALVSSPIRYGRKWCTAEGADQLLGEHARFAGWLKAAAALPAVRKVIMKGQSERGVNSPYTRFSLWLLVKKFPSPHKLERLLWKARKRADDILACWPGERRFSSWAQLARGLMATKKPGKAGIMAAAASLGWDGYGNYRSARDWLVSMRTANFPVADASDGVIGQRAAEPVWSRLGVSVYRLRTMDRYGFKIQLLVRHEKSGRTYHWQEWYDPQRAVKAALAAWSEQDRIAAQEADLVGFLRGDLGYCPIVVREHSYRAGNCNAGTEAWAQQHGLAHRKWIPGQALIPFLKDERVRRVAYACREALLQALKQ